MMHARQRFAPIDYKDRFPALDGLRALAVTLVFLDHFGGGAHEGRMLQMLNRGLERGWVGVDLFFVLSGFLITGILFDTRHDSRYFRRFFARRALRIFPVFYLIVVLVLVLTPFVHYQVRAGHLLFLLYFGNFLGNADFSYYTIASATHNTFQFNIGHFWSLCVEEQFYLLWPLAVWFVRDRIALIRVAVAGSLFALATRAWMVHSFSASFAERWVMRALPFRADSLLLGAVLALMLRGPAADAWQRRSKWIFTGGSFLVLLIFIKSPAYDSPWLLTVGVSLIAIASAGLIGATLRHGSGAFKCFHLRPLRTLGKYSYGFYVFHDIFAWAWITLLMHVASHIGKVAAGLLILPINFLVVFFVSKMSFDYFESRFLRLKKFFEYDSEQSTHRHAFRSK